MIRILKGNLLDANEDIIVHQVNCKGKMNSGVAKAIREKWPIVYKDYLAYFKTVNDKKDLLGDVRFTRVNDKNKHIANMFSQYDYGYNGDRFTNYEALYNGLNYVSHIAKTHNKTVALPYLMGCDRGGANWEIVYKMIEVIFKDIDITIYKLEDK